MLYTIPENEVSRLQALLRLDILDTKEEEIYNEIVKLAANIMDAPFALISFVDTDRQWFKAKFGTDSTETSREVSFCTHAILTPQDYFCVTDATKDPRFQNNPYVVGDAGVRFYFASPLVAEIDKGIGALCVIDTAIRPKPSQHQIDSLNSLAKITMQLLEMRTFVNGMHDEIKNIKTMTDIEFDRSANYKKLNDKCDLIIDKINARKGLVEKK